MESTSEMETALQFYEAARDNLSLVRVYCYCGNLEKVQKHLLWSKSVLRILKQFSLVQETGASFLTNKMQNWNQSRLGHSRFSALQAGCLFWLWVPIG